MIKEAVKKVLPNGMKHNIHKLSAKIAQSREASRNRDKSAREVFSEIYAKAKWGGAVGGINSGSGSYGPAAELYIHNINRFIQSHAVKSVLDIGCGDFSIGSRLICDNYTGIDVAQSVVDRNNAEYSSDGRRFACLDAAGPADLPRAQLCLIRQVLQHLSNQQVTAILRKFSPFEFVILTEHQPAACDFRSHNRDIVHGSNTRLAYGSGLYFDKPPFNLKADLLFEHAGDLTSHNMYDRGLIRSFLVQNSQ